VQDGDLIAIDIPGRTLILEVPEKELQERLAGLPPWEPRIRSGYLKRYAEAVSSASTGAVLKR
jgi:dihydroxy-acid dehydratase